MYREDLLRKAKFKVEIKSDNDYTNYVININEEELTFEEAYKLVKEAVFAHLQDKDLWRAWETMKDRFGYFSTSSYNFSFSVIAYRDTIHLFDQKQTCPSRMDTIGHWEHGENLDHWKIVGDDKCCSFCGGIHPDRVIELIKIHGTEIVGEVELLLPWEERENALGKTQGYTRFIHQPDVLSYHFGGTSFYSSHFNKEQAYEYNKLMLGKKPL